MSGGQGAGTLILSIDLELDVDHHDDQLDGRLDAVRAQLISLTRQHQLAATWAVADPLLSAATESILAANCGHEIAVLGEQAWVGPGCGRVRLRRELARRFTSARKAGIPVSTLALRNTDQVIDLDLLLEHGVTALRGPVVSSTGLRSKENAIPIRFGLWRPPDARRLAPSRGWSVITNLMMRRSIWRAIRRQSIVHLHLDAATLVAAPERTLEIAASILRYVAVKRDAGQLVVRTIAELAREALDERAGTPSRSILRPAA
jgi:hypothetical protein